MRRLALLAALLLAAPASAQETPAWLGVWEGKVGTYPVRLCIDAWGGQAARGAYYYLSRLEPIAVTEQDGEGGWIELGPGGSEQARWEFSEQAGARLRGTWRQGNRRLPFALTPVAWTTDEELGPCGSFAFLGPRMTGGEVLSERAELDGWRYSAQSYRPPAHFAEEVFLESFTFSPEQPGDRPILAELAKGLPTGSHVAPHLQCMGDNITVHGADGYYSTASKPTLVTPDWLNTFDNYDIYCGGAHPSHGFFHRTFDRRSGVQVNLARWLNDAAVEHQDVGGTQEGYDLIRPALRSLIVAHDPDIPFADEDPAAEAYDQSCLELVEGQEFWTFGLSRQGMLFVPSVPHVAGPCMATFEVPWPKLEPFLSDEGRAGLARLRGG